MSKSLMSGLSRRERQIMDLLFQRGRATAADVQRELQDAPSYSAVRALLRILEEKGHVRHEQDGPRYVYVPRHALHNARRGTSCRHFSRDLPSRPWRLSSTRTAASSPTTSSAGWVS